MIGAAVLLMLASATESWPRYTNARFGYSVCYPPGARLRPEAGNGDGRVITIGRADITVFGGYRDDATTPADEVSAQTEGAHATTSYRAARGDWAVASGTKSSRIFYVRAEARGDRMIVVRIDYPAAERRFYDAVAARVSRCLTVGSTSF